MFRRIREPFGKAGLIVGVVALITALAGGAYAASGGLSGHQKKEVKRIAKQFAGKPGPPGAPGQSGSQGPKGDAGAAGANGTDGKDGEAGKNGTNGTDGTDGKSVSIFSLAPGNGEGCEETGGAKFTNGTEEAFACNGKDGEGGSGGGYPETLPSGQTMKGYWEVQGQSGLQFAGFALTTVSFPLPLGNVPTEAILIKTSATEEEKQKCPGSPSEPKAGEAGILCLYPVFQSVTLELSLPSQFGAELAFAETDETWGSWAVKAK